MATHDGTPSDSTTPSEADKQGAPSPESSNDDPSASASQSVSHAPADEAKREQDRQLESGEESPSD